jgi:hypothetical protein
VNNRRRRLSIEGAQLVPFVQRERARGFGMIRRLSLGLAIVGLVALLSVSSATATINTLTIDTATLSPGQTFVTLTGTINCSPTPPNCCSSLFAQVFQGGGSDDPNRTRGANSRSGPDVALLCTGTNQTWSLDVPANPDPLFPGYRFQPGTATAQVRFSECCTTSNEKLVDKTVTLGGGAGGGGGDDD